MLPGPGFGDQPGLSHPPRQQALAQRLVGLVGPPVEQVLALEVDRGPGARGEIAAAVQRRRPAVMGAEEVPRLARDRGLPPGVENRVLELLQGRTPRSGASWTT